jgi:hypothetical protein
MVEPADGLACASEVCACAATALTVKKSNDRAAMEIRIACPLEIAILGRLRESYTLEPAHSGGLAIFTRSAAPSIAKIGGAATPMGIRISVPLPATAHAQSFARWLFA